MSQRVHFVEEEAECDIDGMATGRIFRYPCCGLDGPPDWDVTDDPDEVRCSDCRKWMKENDVQKTERPGEV